MEITSITLSLNLRAETVFCKDVLSSSYLTLFVIVKWPWRGHCVNKNTKQQGHEWRSMNRVSAQSRCSWRLLTHSVLSWLNVPERCRVLAQRFFQLRPDWTSQNSAVLLLCCTAIHPDTAPYQHTHAHALTQHNTKPAGKYTLTTRWAQTELCLVILVILCNVFDTRLKTLTTEVQAVSEISSFVSKLSFFHLH